MRLQFLPYLLAGAAILFTCGEAASQQRDDVSERSKLAGDWIYDSSRGTKLKAHYKSETLTITYSNPRLEIKKVQGKDGETKSATLVLFTDKRGESNNPFPFKENEKLESVTEWKGKSLVVLSAAEMPYKGSKLRFYNREVYSISKDGNSLTIISDMFTDDPKIFFPDTVKKVYQRN